MRRTKAFVGVLLTALIGLTGVASADVVGSNADNTVDAALETVTRNVADGPTTVKLRLVASDNATDLNGCNLGGGSGSKLRLTATSDAPSVATVSQPGDFTTCANDFDFGSTPPAGSEQPITVTPLATGCATISFAVDAANTVILKTPNNGDQNPTFNLAPAGFKVSVGSGCSAPVDPCAGRTAPSAAPTVTVDPASPNGTNDWYKETAPSVTVDPATNAEYSLDGGATWDPYSSAVVLADGQHDVRARNFLPATTTPSCPRLDGPASTSQAVKVDTVDPSIEITSPADGSTTTATSVEVTGTYGDATSGVASVRVNGGAAALGDGFSRTGVPLSCGSNTISATATDNAGNTNSDSASIYRRCFTGTFQQPLDPNGVLNKAKLGRAVPVKLTIVANDGGAVPTPVYFGSRKVSCTAEATDVVEEYLAAGSSNAGNTFRLSDGVWIYNLDTSKLPGAVVGACYQLDVYVGGTVDGAGIASGGVAVQNGSVRIQLIK